MQRFGDVSQEIKRVRKQMEEDEQLASLMRGLRGSNLRDDQFADKDVTMRLVEVRSPHLNPHIPPPPHPNPLSPALQHFHTLRSLTPMESDSLLGPFTL
jgi:aarF domain-containing kinase